MTDAVSFEQALETHGKIVYTNVGVSMMPLLREGRDLIVIEKTQGRLKKFDVPLYKKNGRYVLHRIVKVCPDSYVIVGDHCTRKEYGITDRDVIGVLTSVVRDGKEISLDSFGYKLYVHLWCDFYPLRVLILKTKSLIRAGLKRLCRNNKQSVKESIENNGKQ